MRKVLSLILASALMLGLCACGAPAADDPTETTLSAAQKLLHGKKIIFIGNSHTYVGKVVTQVYNSVPQQEKRNNNKGLFYQICAGQGCEVEVTNWTFSSHGLNSIFGGECTTKGDCQGKNHEEFLTDRFFDYVVIQPGVGKNSEDNIAKDIDYVVDFFKKVNPDAKFVLLGNASVYGNNATDTPYPGITSYYKTLAEKGFIMADWGKLVNDLIKGEVKPENSTVVYEKNSFIIKDGFHPNMLSGYIASVMTYCAITGEAAAQLPANLFKETAMSILVDDQLENSYDRGELDSNFKTVLTIESELKSIHKLIDQYLAEKPYLQN